MELGGKQISYGSELARKGIHLASVGIPLVYLNVPHSVGMTMLFALTAFSVVVDIVKHYHAPTRRLIMKLFGNLMRSHEVQQYRLLLTGASWVLIAAFATLLVFPTVVAVTAFTILIISDSFAALVGRRVSSRPFLDKSLAGTATFVIASWLVVAFYAIAYSLPLSYVVCASIAGVVGGLVEAASIRLRLDDNLSIPFSVALTMMALNWVLIQTFKYPSFTDLLP